MLRTVQQRGVRSGLVIRQNGAIYRAAAQDIARNTLEQWRPLELECLTAPVFIQWPRSGGMPNFEDGGEIEFGFRRYVTEATADPIRNGVDNWTVTIHRSP